MDCLFCKIIAGEIPSTKVYEDELAYAFRDINPQAPTHILIVPKAHIGSVDEITPDNAAVVAHIFTVIARHGGGISETFTVRHVSYGCGVEKTFPIHSPNVVKVVVTRRGVVRRAKLYYLRDRVGKSAKVKEKI